MASGITNVMVWFSRTNFPGLTTEPYTKVRDRSLNGKARIRARKAANKRDAQNV